MAALVSSQDMISSKEITYNVKKMREIVVNWRSLCVLVSCCCELRSLSLNFITLLDILFIKKVEKGYFVHETTKV